jgi:hypothetical protein
MELAKQLVTILSRKGQCFSEELEIVFAVMAVVDGAICAVAAVQASHTSHFTLPPSRPFDNLIM